MRLAPTCVSGPRFAGSAPARAHLLWPSPATTEGNTRGNYQVQFRAQYCLVTAATASSNGNFPDGDFGGGGGGGGGRGLHAYAERFIRHIGTSLTEGWNRFLSLRGFRI